MADQPTAQELILAIRAKGVPMKLLAEECERHPSLLYQVAAGKRPGRNLLPALLDIARTGSVQHRPERRTGKDGKPVKVRGKRGQPSRPPKASVPAARTRGKFSRTTALLAGGGRVRRVTAPKSGRVGRFDAQEATMCAIAEAARERRRVSFVVHFADDSTVSLGSKGGYRGNAVYTRAMGEWENAFEWLSEEVEAVDYRSDRDLETTITGVDITIFGEPDPGQEVPEDLHADPTLWVWGADDE